MQGVRCLTLAVTSIRLHQLHHKNLSFLGPAEMEDTEDIRRFGSDPADINLSPAAV